MTTLFISDLHLDEQYPDLIRAFLQLLADEACRSDALYILGDLFEAWVGDDDDSPVAVTVTRALRTLSDSGVPVYFMHGNRDFLIGERFAQNAGVTLLEDPTVINLYGKQTLLMHGDSLCTNDLPYQTFRQMVRSPQWQTEISGKPLAERRSLARQLRKNSVEAKSNKAEDIMDVNLDEVVRVMKKHRVQILIHGHTHRPAVHCLEIAGHPAKRYVLGDWGSSSWVLRASDHHLSLDSHSLILS